MATQPDPGTTTTTTTSNVPITDNSGTILLQEDLIEQHLAASRKFPDLIDPADVEHLEVRILPDRPEQVKSRGRWLSIE